MSNVGKYICTRWAVELGKVKVTLPLLTTAVAAVQPEERERLMKFHFYEDFMHSLVGRLLMRKFVASFTKIPYHDIKLLRDENNKPYWPSVATEPVLLQFNVSHHDGIVVFAGVMCAKDASNKLQSFGVGVDVMKIVQERPFAEFLRLMRRQFSSKEWDFITKSNFNEEQQFVAFMRYWTLKEALAKEMGVGLRTNFAELSFGLQGAPKHNELPITDTDVHIRGVCAKNYVFEEHVVQDIYGVTIAYRDCEVPKDKFKILAFSDLLVETELSNNKNVFDYATEVLLKETKS